MNPSATWHPVTPSAEVRAGANIVAGFAQGQELALWRAADGSPQAWENRCPHRSVRFTLGQVTGGDRLACAYHGWQYEAGSGACVRIPAHPAMPAPRNVCAKTFATADAAGMLWVRLAADGPSAPAELANAVPAGWHLARTLTLRVAASEVRAALAPHGFASTGTPDAWQGTLDDSPVAALLLDAQPQLSFLHLWTDAAPGSDAMARVHRAARQLRSDIEAAASH
ncbi:Methylxanthine N1-demethylase NdmA [Variovorax boronicumulans]|uniref:Rieske (2Fe-2S) protein n=1 Tax=Variovorax boronicumulans TaxID=436515 RepID=UPI000BB2E2B0|nr:Rieske (2Fe-2S) protein [Variovorax boronicumulans]PBI83436.1 Methylxanthine N1-demethylase NdmA [Variovorax boronicumulans]